MARAAIVAACALALATAPAPAAPVPRGTAVWWACMEESYSGPAWLACPRPYDPRYRQTVLSAFERMTPENEFKMVHLQPRHGTFDFALADRIAAFAREHGRRIRGHALVWGEDLPGWVTAPRVFEWRREEALAAMSSHIRTVVRHFAGRFPGVVEEWDVVNEPLAADGRLAPTFWRTRIGADYIERALRVARAADPRARLVINEVDVERPGAKSDALLALVRRLKQRGVPLDAVGWQMHLRSPEAAPAVDELVALMRRYDDLGLDVQVTEMDVAAPATAAAPAGMRAPDEAQAAAYRRVAQACRLAPNCSGFTVWGVADPYSWLGEAARALLFDASFRPKPHARAVAELLSRPASRRPVVVRGRRGSIRGRRCRWSSRRGTRARPRSCRVASGGRRKRRAAASAPGAAGRHSPARR